MSRNLFTLDLLSKEKKSTIANAALIYAERMHNVAVELRSNKLDKDKINFSSCYSAAISVLNQMEIIINMINPLEVIVPVTIDLGWLKIHANESVVDQDWYKLSACTETLLIICKEIQGKSN